MNLRLLLPVSTVALAAILADAPQSYAASRIEVNAGEFERSECVVAFDLPMELRQNHRLLAEGEEPVPLQVDPAGRASFILRRLAKGQTRTYRLEAREPRSDPAVQIQEEADQMRLTVLGAPALGYQGKPGPFPRADIDPVFRRGGYLHPVMTPSGKIVTDDFPLNHVHHHGIWFAWTKTEFNGREPDFWNMKERKGTVEFAALDATWSGTVHGGFRSRHRFLDLTESQPTPALDETWQVQAYAMRDEKRPSRIFDLVSTQTCAGSAPLKLPEYHYGGIGFRGAWAWNGQDRTFFLTSEGETDRVKAHATRARWCHIGGQLDGTLAGIAILGHPQNYRAPQPMRIHPSEPFFCFAPQQLGAMEIAPGTTYVSRYRFVVSDGPPDRAEIDRLWNDYAHPPKVSIK